MDASVLGSLIGNLSRASARVDTMYVSYVNSDTTEGRGKEVPIAVSNTAWKASKAAAHKSVQGCDGTAHPEKMLVLQVTLETGRDVVLAVFPDNVWEVGISTPEELAEAKNDLVKKALSKLSMEEKEALGLLREDIMNTGLSHVKLARSVR